MTLRLRVAAAAAAAIVLAIVLVGVVVIVVSERDLSAGLDRDLRDRATAVAQLVATAPALVTAPGGLEQPLSGHQVAVEVLDRNGAIVARSSALASRPLPAVPIVGAALSGRAGFTTATVAGEEVRLFAAPLAHAAAGPAAGGAVVVAATTADRQAAVRRLRRVTLLAALVAAVLGGGAAWLLVRRAVRPLARLSATAAEIGRSADPGARLPDTGGRDEVARLAGTLNDMLAALERAREAERRFVGDVSHELRTPLTALRGNAAFAARHGADAPLLRELADNAERLARLVDDLLALAHEDSSAPPEAIVHLDELAHAAAEGSDDVDVDAPAPVPVRGDRAALERALANLVENARRYGPAGGRIRVSARTGDRARLAVDDDGPGLVAADEERVFRRFVRGSAAAGIPGSGLGLAIVRATAERHGGQALVSGGTFAIELPPLRDLSEPGATPHADTEERPA